MTGTPSKPWRITTPDTTTDYSSERRAYDDLTANAGWLADVGTKVDVHHLEDGRWVLYERAVITEGGWEPA